MFTEWEQFFHTVRKENEGMVHPCVYFYFANACGMLNGPWCCHRKKKRELFWKIGRHCIFRCRFFIFFFFSTNIQPTPAKCQMHFNCLQFSLHFIKLSVEIRQATKGGGGFSLGGWVYAVRPRDLHTTI